MGCTAPRSTSSHWGSLKALDQRVPVFPSTALAATQVEPGCTDDAVTGIPWDSMITGSGARGVWAVTEGRGVVVLPLAAAPTVLPLAAAVLSAPGRLVAAIATTTAAATMAVATTIASAVTSERRRLGGPAGPPSPAGSDSVTVAAPADHAPGAGVAPGGTTTGTGRGWPGSPSKAVRATQNSMIRPGAGRACGSFWRQASMSATSPAGQPARSGGSCTTRCAPSVM